MAKKRSTAAEMEALLDPRVQAELALTIPGFDRAGLLSSLLEVWGGQDKLAASLYVEFQHASPGSMVRQRILELICRMISQHSDSEPPIAVDQLDDEGLRQAILRFAGPLAEKVGVQIGNQEAG